MAHRNVHALAAAALAIGICGLPQSALAQPAQPKTFSSAGQEEITRRRIGENETRVIETLALIDETAPAEGSRDGYWFKAVSGQAGTTDRAVGTSGTRAPTGKSISGIRFVVYPIDYRSSGVMTFIVTEDGRVFEKDLGPETSARAPAIDGRVEAAGWKPVN